MRLYQKRASEYIEPTAKLMMVWASGDSSGGLHTWMWWRRLLVESSCMIRLRKTERSLARDMNMGTWRDNYIISNAHLLQTNWQYRSLSLSDTTFGYSKWS